MAPSTLASSSGELMAALAASTARFSPPATPIPMSAEPASFMTVRTSAKSRLMRPGTVIRSVMPCTPWRSTSSATLKASMIDVRALDDLQQPVVGDDDQGVDLLAQLADAVLGLPRPALALEHEGPRDHADRERPELLGELRDDRRGAGAGAAALARRDEDHVGALDRVAQLVLALDGRLIADVGVGARSQAPRDLAADVDLDVGIAHLQRLGVGVDGDELDAPQSCIDHAIDRVGASAAHADDFDDREVVA